MKLELIAKHEKDSRACRDAFALTLKDMMAADKSVCYVDCDLMGCVNTKPKRAESNSFRLRCGKSESQKTENILVENHRFVFSNAADEVAKNNFIKRKSFRIKFYFIAFSIQ